jgi:hypothetical protein
VVSDTDPATPDIDLRDFVEDPGVDVPLLAEFLRCDGDEGFHVVDDTADVVGDTSGRIGDVGTLFEDDDFKVLSASAGL